MDMRIGERYDVAFRAGVGFGNGTWTLEGIDFVDMPEGGLRCVPTMGDGLFDVGFPTSDVCFMVPHKDEAKAEKEGKK